MKVEREMKNGWVYRMDRTRGNEWPVNNTPDVEDFLVGRWDVAVESVGTTRGWMALYPKYYLAPSCPEWYMLNGMVFTAPALYKYITAFYPLTNSQTTKSNDK